MSEYNDIAGSDDIMSVNYESQETFNEHSYRIKQSANRIDKNVSSTVDQAKENQKPIEQVSDEEIEAMQADTQNYSLPTVNNGVSAEQSPPPIDTQNTLTSTTPFIIRPQLAESTLTDENSVSVEKDSLPVRSPIHEERNIVTESTSKLKLDSNASGLDVPTTTNDIRLYISPSTSLLETTSVEDAQPNPDNISTTEIEGKRQETELNDKPKEEPMDTSDAQASLGSDGIIESYPTSALNIESTSVSETSTKIQSPVQSKISISPTAKALYSLSQPTTNKFETILAKLITSPSRQVTPTIENKSDLSVTIREEEELFIKESISKTVRRYAVKSDQNGRTLSRELLIERVVEENTTTRVESWPPSEKKIRRSVTKITRLAEPVRKKPTKSTSPKRKTKSLKPTATVVSPKTSKVVQSDNDEVSKTNKNEDSSDDDNDNEDNDDEPTDNISGDEFTPIPRNSAGESLKKGLRVFAKWVDGHFYPGIIGSVVKNERFMIEFDDGAKRYVKAHEIISQSYLEVNQNVMVQTQDGYSTRGIVKRLIKKKKTGTLGYIVENDGKEKWYPLRFVSLTHEQAEHLPIVNNNNNNTTEESTNLVQGKRKRTSTVPQSPNKKTKSSITVSPNKKTKSSIFVSPNKKPKNSTSVSPNKSQRSTPTRQTKLFNTMYFLLTGFNDSMDVRHQVQDSIESHGGKVIEKMPNTNRRDNVYLVSDVARKTAKFFDAKKLNIPCVNYKWINESIDKSEVQDCELYKLILSEKETKKNNKKIIGDEED